MAAHRLNINQPPPRKNFGATELHVMLSLLGGGPAMVVDPSSETLIATLAGHIKETTSTLKATMAA